MEAVAGTEKDRTGRIAATILSGVNLSVGLYVVVSILPLLYRRLTFPGVLEHQESTTIYLLYRMAESLGNLYQTPSLGSESVIYNPAYYFYLWVLSPLLGYQSMPIRIASVVPPLLLCAGLIEFVGRKYMHVPRLGWSWTFVSLAVYPLVTWIDLARLEALLLLSIVLVWFTLCLDDDWRPKFILVGLAITFSFAVKQSGALLILAPAVLALTDRRYLLSVTVAGGAIALFIAVMFFWYGEPYLFWAFREPASHPFEISEAAIHLREIVGLAPLILLGPLLWLARGIDFKSPAGKLMVLTFVTMAISTLGAGKLGGWYTQYVILLFLAAIPGSELIRRGLRTQNRSDMRYGAVIFLVLMYSIVMTETGSVRSLKRPDRADRRQQAALLEVVRGVPGETWVTSWPHIDLWAGHPVNASITFQDKYQPATEETERAIRDRRFALIVTSPERPTQFDDPIQRHYLPCCSLPMRHFGARLFLPTEVWARSPDEREAVLRALSLEGKSAEATSD